MAAIAIVGVVSFLIFLVSRQAMRAGGGRTQRYQPQWYELLLAAVLLLVVVVLLLWHFLPWAGADWGGEGRSMTFSVIMLIIGGGGLAVFLLTMFWRIAQRRAEAPAAGTRAAPEAAAPAPEVKARHEAPSAMRLLGILGIGLGFLILNWAHVPLDQQKTMMLNLVYPAGLIVALVMLFDKASRTWNVKLPGETLREWLHCNAFVFLYLIAYLNLLGAPEVEGYGGMFWDFLNVAAFLLMVWIIDRKTSRLRFLLSHAYLMALPILLLVWQMQMGIERPEGVEIGWWETVWPFFFLALIGFVVELIILIANRDSDAQGAGTAKDVVFLILYVILLLIARPEAVA